MTSDGGGVLLTDAVGVGFTVRVGVLGRPVGVGGRDVGAAVVGPAEVGATGEGVGVITAGVGG
ncbi:hypothetical protein, partial [Micromonospora sp. RTGN7]|uniref:hypothetical protein n=1 Tax=Micromonospora sp. RTGN7 TaxID=3016526 RepID=UPI0029FECA66